MSADAPNRAERRRLRQRYRRLYDGVLGILARHDLMNIALLPDEYEPETDTILPRLKEAASVADLQRIVHEEFVRWFAGEAGPIEQYEPIARDIWDLMQKEQHELA